MRKYLLRTVLALTLIVACWFLANHALLLYARRALAGHFPGAHTALGAIRLSPSKILLERFSTKTADWHVEGNVAFNWRGEIAWADVSLPNLRAGDLEIRNARMTIPSPSKPGVFRIDKLNFKKMSIENIDGVSRIDGKNLTVEPFGSSGPYGRFAGKFRVKLEKDFACEGSLELFRAAPALILHALEWDSKASLTGFFSGTLAFRGNRFGLEQLDGQFNAESPGGELNITDSQMFADLAVRTKQPVELIEAGFSSYHFDTGRLAISTDGHDLRSEILLQGPAGRRRLEPIIHDFFKKENE